MYSGMAVMTSTTRRNTESTRPPCQPAAAPIGMPMSAASSGTVMPTSIEVRAP